MNCHIDYANLSNYRMRRQFALEHAGAVGALARHQVGDSVTSNHGGLPGNQFGNPMSSTQEGLTTIRCSNTISSNQGGLSNLQFSMQPSPIPSNYIPLSQQASNGVSSSCTRQLSNPASNLHLHGREILYIIFIKILVAICLAYYAC